MDDLRGMWAAMPLPWNADGSLDTGAMTALVERYAAAGLHGAYCTGTDGEFHTLELDEFRTVVTAFARAAERVHLPVHAGTGWLTLRGAIERTRIARDVGIHAVQVVPPFWVPVNDIERIDFYRALADAVPDVGILVYNTERIGKILGAAQIQALAVAVPSIVGSKYDGWDRAEFAEICAATPDLVASPGGRRDRPVVGLPDEGALLVGREPEPRVDDGLVAGDRGRRLGRVGPPLHAGDGRDDRLGSAARAAHGVVGAVQDLHARRDPAVDAAPGPGAVPRRDGG